MKKLIATCAGLATVLTAMPAFAYYNYVQEAYTVSVPYTYTAYRDVQETYQVVVPDYGWVADSDWTDQEDLVSTSLLKVGQSGVQPLTVVAKAASGQSATFFSDRSNNGAKTVLSSSKVRKALGADHAVMSKVKVATLESGSLGGASSRKQGSSFTTDQWKGDFTVSRRFKVHVSVNPDGSCHFAPSYLDDGAWKQLRAFDATPSGNRGQTVSVPGGFGDKDKAFTLTLSEDAKGQLTLAASGSH